MRKRLQSWRMMHTMIDPHSYDSCRLLFASYQIPLSPEQYEKLHIYADLLVNESKRQNVTAVRGLSEIWIRHFLDFSISNNSGSCLSGWNVGKNLNPTTFRPSLTSI